MTRFSLAVLPGDGIGPEVTAEALKVLRAAADLFGYRVDTTEYAVGAAGVAESGDSLPERTRSAVTQADAVLLGAVGHPDLAAAEGKRRPEAGLLALRKLLGAYANLRPVMVYPSLLHASPLRPDAVARQDGDGEALHERVRSNAAMSGSCCSVRPISSSPWSSMPRR